MAGLLTRHCVTIFSAPAATAVRMWKVFARLRVRKNLPHSHEKGSQASQAR
jgi:hypothetical protein